MALWNMTNSEPITQLEVNNLYNAENVICEILEGELIGRDEMEQEELFCLISDLKDMLNSYKTI